jgi:hypothetical protein
MLFEETDTEESGDSQSDVSSLDNGFSRMQFESSSSEAQVTDDGDDDMNSQVWGQIQGVRKFIYQKFFRISLLFHLTLSTIFF